MVTNGDKGGEGVKNQDFYGDILFEWPPKKVVHLAVLLFFSNLSQSERNGDPQPISVKKLQRA